MSQEIQNAAVAVQEVAHVAEATGGLGTLGINLKIFLAQLVNFLVVLLVLRKWAYGPIIKMLDKRSEKIEQSMKHADEIEKRMESTRHEQKDILKLAKTEAVKIIETARTQSEKQSEKMITNAKNEVQQVVQKGKIQLQTEKTQMIQDVKKEIAQIAVEASKKILEDAIDEKKSQKIAEDVVEKAV